MSLGMSQWVHVPTDELERIVVVSPHFDDAVQGAGYVLAGHPGSVVITVLGGRPPAYPETLSEWDALGGFKAGDDIVALRRGEDTAALAELDAVPHWLEFSDHQYLDKNDWYQPKDIAPALAAAIRHLEPTAVFIPFGLANPDHDLTHRAARIVMDDLDGIAWFCYEDAGYCHLPGLLAWRISALFSSGLWPTPALVPVSLDPDRKHRALAAYRSQLPPLKADHMLDARIAAPAVEQYWRLARPPAGWEGLVDVPG
jgi:LmbE family N-acetylglucosaminyl deacetylase